ncbi:MAG TPA: hypothetical protein PLM29_10800 [Deltaproteobacteria bacterium]|nr:hypothetical protein [Deltaproteobacteria bacterium]
MVVIDLKMFSEEGHTSASLQKKWVMSVAQRWFRDSLTDFKERVRGLNPLNLIFTPHPFLCMIRCTFFRFTTRFIFLLSITTILRYPYRGYRCISS